MAGVALWSDLHGESPREPSVFAGDPDTMNLPTIMAISVGLAMDAMAVSAARGFAAQSVRLRDVVRVALFFGGFQALMPLLGWFLGDAVGPLVAVWAHWIALALLGIIGAKMLWEAWAKSKTSPVVATNDELFDSRVLLLLAIATSIDALAVGITLPMLGAPMLLSLACIGTVTAALSALGLLVGRRLGATLGRGLDALGGLILIALGVKIVLDRLDLL